MQIGGLQEFSLVDYPEHYSCVVSLTGCNWRCPWCRATDFVLPEISKRAGKISEKRILDFLKQKQNILEAVVISGGEPTIHKDLPKLCSNIKKLKYKVKLDTNGSNPEMLNNLITNNLVDYIALDIKAPKAKYPLVIGFKGSLANYLIDNVEKSINLLKQNNVPYEFTTTFSPQLTRKDVLQIAHWIRPAKKYRLQLCHIQDQDEEQETQAHRTLFSIQQAITPFFDECDIR
ncbi:MAG: anaerobic ribonucleoside-triphosphate reductase activating protein [Parcubacteria group bacterium]|nr:anaerobic ribonucleoside-triphosphate reductase activating protein [Parcubacteria group bacterium]